jgi:hypothetical protein
MPKLTDRQKKDADSLTAAVHAQYEANGHTPLDATLSNLVTAIVHSIVAGPDRDQPR